MKVAILEVGVVLHHLLLLSGLLEQSAHVDVGVGVACGRLRIETGNVETCLGLVLAQSEVGRLRRGSIQ